MLCSYTSEKRRYCNVYRTSVVFDAIRFSNPFESMPMHFILGLFGSIYNQYSISLLNIESKGPWILFKVIDIYTRKLSPFEGLTSSSYSGVIETSDQVNNCKLKGSFFPLKIEYGKINIIVKLFFKYFFMFLRESFLIFLRRPLSSTSGPIFLMRKPKVWMPYLGSKFMFS